MKNFFPEVIYIVKKYKTLAIMIVFIFRKNNLLQKICYFNIFFFHCLTFKDKLILIRFGMFAMKWNVS